MSELGTLVSIQIPSSTDTTKWYVLKLEWGKWKCSCPGFQFHKKCKHSDLSSRYVKEIEKMLAALGLKQ